MISKEQMTDEQRKSVVLEYFRGIDRMESALEYSRDEEFLELFAEDAQLLVPKWGEAFGREEIESHFRDVSSAISSIRHHYGSFNYVIQDATVAVEGESHGVTGGGVEFRAGVTHAGRFCDVFEIRDFQIQRLFVYLDPDYASADTERYPRLNTQYAGNGRTS